jgi:predicted dehydrogenase
MKKRKLNIAMIGTGFIAKAHSNAFRQVTHFFDVPYQLNLKVVCGRTSAKSETAVSLWRWEETFN